MARRITLFLLIGLLGVICAVTVIEMAQCYRSVLGKCRDHGCQDATIGARLSEHVIERALDNGNFDLKGLFDDGYERVPGENSKRFFTTWSRYLDRHLRSQLSAFVDNKWIYYAYLVDRNGFVVIHTDARQNGTFLAAANVTPANNASGGATCLQLTRKLDGHKYREFRTPVIVRGQCWGDFCLGIPTALIHNKVAKQLRQVVLSMVVFSALLSGIVYFIIRRSLIPLINVAEATRKVAGGDRGIRCPETGCFELDMLTHAFNEMAKAIEKRETELGRQNRVLRDEVQRRHQAETELAANRDNLAEIVEARTAALSAANEKLEQTNQELERQVHERHRAETALRLTQFAIDEAPNGALWIDSSGQIAYANHSTCRMLGCAPEVLLGKDVIASDLALPASLAPDNWLNIQENGCRCETEIRSGSGTVIPAELTAHILEFGERRYLCVFIHDITLRRKAECKLRRQAEELSEQVKKLKCRHGISAILEESELPFEEMLHRTLELIRSTWQHPEVTCVRIILKGKSYATSNFLETPWKMSHPVLIGGNLGGALEVCYLEERSDRNGDPFLDEERMLLEDIANRLGSIVEKSFAEAEMRRLKHQIEFVLGATKTGLDIVDAEGVLTYVDPETERCFGNWYRKPYREYFRDRLVMEGEIGMEKALRTQDVVVSEVTIHGEDTRIAQVTSIPFQDDDGRSYVAQVNADITERKRMEMELAQSQKMESIGELAAGIAHEINTPTQYIGDNTRFLQDAFHEIVGMMESVKHLLGSDEQNAPGQSLRDRLESVLEEAEFEYLAEETPKAIQQSLEGIDRVASIVRAMKEFSHPGDEDQKVVDLNHALETTLTISRNEWKYVAEVKREFAQGLPLVPCFPGDLNQAFLNVIVNAAHAVRQMLPEGSNEKGTITVRTFVDDGWVQVEIEDTGTGVPDEIANRVFDPFFTTKDVGQGTGQGLTLVHSVIVEKHRGTVKFHNVPHGGVCFVIRLPLKERDFPATGGNHSIMARHHS